MMKPENPIPQGLLANLDEALIHVLQIGTTVVLVFVVALALLIIGSEKSKGNNGSAFLIALTVVLFLAHIVKGMLA